jgi:hypothetical protein
LNATHRGAGGGACRWLGGYRAWGTASGPLRGRRGRRRKTMMTTGLGPGPESPRASRGSRRGPVCDASVSGPSHRHKHTHSALSGHLPMHAYPPLLPPPLPAWLSPGRARPARSGGHSRSARARPSEGPRRGPTLGRPAAPGRHGWRRQCLCAVMKVVVVGVLPPPPGRTCRCGVRLGRGGGGRVSVKCGGGFDGALNVVELNSVGGWVSTPVESIKKKKAQHPKQPTHTYTHTHTQNDT